jgi:hypothetical protein
MNERINELKHQASLWCDRNIPEQYSEETNGYGNAWEDKFAELIINACATVGDFAEIFAENGRVLKPSVMIKEYFGVES